VLRLRGEAAQQLYRAFLNDADVAGKSPTTGETHRSIERRKAFTVFDIEGRASIDERLDYVVVALQRGAMQRRATASVDRVDLDSAFEQ
jgi:hypothetical protein